VLITRDIARKMFAKVLSALVLISLFGCSPDATVALYKHNYKGALIDVCAKDKACTADVETFFDQCLDGNEVKQMLLTLDPERSRDLNRELQRKAVECINTASGVNHFHYGAQEEKKT